ncbi:MAG: hypothetical protein ABSD13_09310 [Candidatus Korobacteraceae bacterium]
MSFRWISAALLPLALVWLGWPVQVSAQAVAAPAEDNSTPPIIVQIAPPPISISSAMLGISSPLGAQAAAGKPMFAEFITEHHQSFTDGNRISRTTASYIYRDAAGRIRRESQLSVPGFPAGFAASTFITIVDQQLGYGYVLDPQEMIAHRYELNAAVPAYVARLSTQSVGSALLGSNLKQPAASSASPAASEAASTTTHWHMHVFPLHRSRATAENTAASGSAQGAGAPGASGGSAVGQLSSGFLSENSDLPSAPTMRIDQPFLAAPNPMRTENLGEQSILGFHVHGTRVLTTLPAGQIGNERPIDIVSEQWFSPELEVVMRSMHRDPWAGEFTTTVTRIRRGDQPASLFEVPAAYKVIDAASEDEHHVLDGHGSHSPGPAPW